jgi:GMP synthase (glutamine-hydrolysing)
MSIKKREEIKALLIQLRLDDETMIDEHNQFATHTGIKKENIDSLYVFQVEDYDVAKLEDYDLLLVGGSSDDKDALLVEDTPTFARIAKKVLRRAYEMKLPVFASCFGFQVAVVEFGGKLVYDESSEEFGTLPFTLTEEAQDDILFHDTPSPFHAVVGHKKFATALPSGAVNLAKTDVCAYHAFKFTDRPFYGFQFHPELTKKQLIEWLTRYKDRYFETEEQFIRATTGHVEVPEANALLGKFIDRIVLKEQ